MEKQFKFIKHIKKNGLVKKNPSWDKEFKYRVKPTKIEFKDCSFNDTEYCVNKFSMVLPFDTTYHNIEDKKGFIKDREIAEAYAVLPQLIRLRNEYNEGWKPDYKYSDSKFGIYNFKDDLSLFESCYASRILIFKTAEIRNNFLKDHKDLLEIAKPLL